MDVALAIAGVRRGSTPDPKPKAQAAAYFAAAAFAFASLQSSFDMLVQPWPLQLF
jgi:hypothetical protein